jgi:hypothetical protein
MSLRRVFATGLEVVGPRQFRAEHMDRIASHGVTYAPKSCAVASLFSVAVSVAQTENRTAIKCKLLKTLVGVAGF